MADDADTASSDMQLMEDAAIARVRADAEIKPGQSGECFKCEEMSPRLIGGACAPCRDKYKLPCLTWLF